MKKRLFIFDMGGVMCTNTNVMDAICNELGLTKREFLDFAKYENFINIQSGEMKMNDFWQTFSETSGIKVKKDYFEILFNPIRNDKMYQLIDQLKQEVRVVAGTNTIDSHYKKHLNNGDYDVFEKVYPSNLIGVAKPNADFYRFILEKENIHQKETLFIDDNAENVEAAEKLGITAIHFTTYEDLIEKIKKFQ